MNVLYITSFRTIAQASGGYINDYLNDLTFHGFYELQKQGEINEVVDSIPIISLYQPYIKDIPKQNIWGGFTACNLIENDDVCRSDLVEKIRDKYFDLVIYGAVRRCQDYWDIVHQSYSKNQIVYLDGSDDNSIDDSLSGGTYFKRELSTEKSGIKPISFSIPKSKICSRKPIPKEQSYGTVIPGQKDTYIFTEEDSYYQDYQKSYFGVTQKKAGWDCMRHYEILANYCMPYFIDLEDCPDLCLFNFPKEAVQAAKTLADWEFNETQYYELLDYVFEYTQKNLTTDAIARYILASI